MIVVETKPSVTAIMPVRNGSFFLNNSLNSILLNMQEKDQLIVIDDGSEDDTNRILSSYASKDSRVNLIRTNGVGVASALNLGISESENNLIARFDVDDVYPANRLTVQRSIVKENIVASFSDFSFIDSNTSNIGFVPTAIFPNATAISLVGGVRTPHSSAMYRKDAVLEAGGYLINDAPAEDLSLWLRLIRLGDITTCPEEFLKYRLSPHSLTIRQKELSVSRKYELLQRYGIDLLFYNNVMDNLDELKKGYNFHAGNSRRFLLLLRELRVYSNIFQVGSIKSLELVKEFLKGFEVEMLAEAGAMVREKRKRDRLRHHYNLTEEN